MFHNRGVARRVRSNVDVAGGRHFIPAVTPRKAGSKRGVPREGRSQRGAQSQGRRFVREGCGLARRVSQPPLSPGTGVGRAWRRS